ncbi:ABC transporter ATP-binding protein [candidate division KSB1 bacterium]|nr:ABC transporter ATP-binding protein [bacterium]OQX60610.1 MAG: ABC transporter [candidate division KSB1 bacterium 4484_219]RKY77331.1 MAG: ABC transporter ATP-binding protein [candidate division KSB1 bacterium]
MIELKNLTRSFNGLVAVDNVSLFIPSGQICGYLGPNGAGKTTTVKMLTGMLKPTSGTALVDGFDILQQPLEVKKRIGYVPESGALYENLTPLEYLQLVGRLYHMDEKVLEEKIDEFLRLFKLWEHKNQRMKTFSKGMKQKIVISAALVHNPSVIFLDEPLSGLDANTALLLKNIFRRLAEQGKTIFYCSHILEVVEKICDRIVIIDHGKIVADGTINQLRLLTSQSSLEAIFSKVTHSEDMAEIAEAFSKVVGTMS